MADPSVIESYGVRVPTSAADSSNESAPDTEPDYIWDTERKFHKQRPQVADADARVSFSINHLYLQPIHDWSV